ncbi:MAG: hypothetical protein WC365_06600 [Candidatus Babeliales bacterium]|jgi:DNA-directed RNA polymerase subunit F
MGKLIKFKQKIVFDAIHDWVTVIQEYAIPKYEIVFNYYNSQQINIIDDAEFTSRFVKGFDKQEIEVSDEFIEDIVMFQKLKHKIVDTLTKIVNNNIETLCKKE